MQTLGLSDTTPHSENRLKSLLWPSIQSGADVDYLGAQGYWICSILALYSFIFLIATNHPVIGLLALLFYYLGGVGVRERSIFAAAIVFIFYLVSLLASGPSIIGIVFAALLLANLRATSLASGWKPDSEEAALPPRLNETWGDKFADQLPAWLWPKVRIPYYIFSLIFMCFVALGLSVTILRHMR